MKIVLTFYKRQYERMFVKLAVGKGRRQGVGVVGLGRGGKFVKDMYATAYIWRQENHFAKVLLR